MKTIAIIDDDVHIGDVLAEILENEGYAVTRAYSGTEALYLLSDNMPYTLSFRVTVKGQSVKLTRTAYAVFSESGGDRAGEC